MSCPTRNVESAIRFAGATGVLLLCAFAALLVAGPATAGAQEFDESELRSSENTALAAGETVFGELDTQGQGGLIASGGIGTCVWEIDANGKLTLAPADGNEGTLDFYNPVSSNPNSFSSEDHRAPWYPYASKITSAKVEGSITVTGETCKMFWDCRNLVDVDLAGLDISQVSSFGYMFANCFKLRSVDMSMLEAPSARYTNNMFCDCNSMVISNRAHCNGGDFGFQWSKPPEPPIQSIRVVIR